MDPANLPPGQRFANRYVIRKRLGLGGMGAVYVALDENTDSECALKVLYGQALFDARSLDDFKREAKITGPFTGDARGLVVRVTDAGLDPVLTAPFLVMELLEGEELAARVAREGRLAPAAVLRVAAQLATVLDEAHRRGIVHRDLKPENLFLARVGPVEVLKVLDFGIAKVLRDNASLRGSRIIGSPLYMAPEQWDTAVSVGPGTDLWALGLIVFLALVGGPYWRGTQIESLAGEILVRELPAASARAAEHGAALPPGFDAWFARCVCRDPAGRFRSAGEAVASLGTVMGSASPAAVFVTPPLGATISAPPPPGVTLFAPPPPGALDPARVGARRAGGRMGLVGAAFAGALLIVVGVALWPSKTPASTSSGVGVAPVVVPPLPPPAAPGSLPLSAELAGLNPFVALPSSGFAMQRHEVTVQEIARWSTGTSAAPLDASRPAAAIEWAQARGFCEALGATLPSQAWWLAALDDRTGWATGILVGTPGDDVEVRANDVSPSGIHDLVGGVSEWLLDEPQPGVHAYIGASFADDPTSVRWLVLHARSAPTSPDAAERLRVSRSRGFRCARPL